MAFLNWNNISSKNALAVAAPLALSDALLQLGSVKKVNGRTESFIEHEFSYFDEIPQVMSYLLGPVVLAAVVFASATLFGKVAKNTDGKCDDWKTAATGGAHLAFKMLLAVVGANLGEELVGESDEGMFVIAALAGLGVVIADAISVQQVYKYGLRVEAYRNYWALFFAVVAASIFFSFSPELGMIWGKAVEFENLQENDMGHAWLASTTTFVTAGASFGLLMPVLMPVAGKEQAGGEPQQTVDESVTSTKVPPPERPY